MRRLLKKDRNGLKLILAILLLLIVCIFIEYFFWSWAELKDNSTALIIIAMHTLVLTANIKLLIIL